MRVVIIGGSGHIGSYLTPLLVEDGHDVTAVSRSRREPYFDHPAWQSVRKLNIDRQSIEFGPTIAALKPEVVIDLICYSLESAQQLAEGLRGTVQQFLHCGTIWVHGPGVEVPITEEQPRRPISDYGRRKAAIEAYLLAQAREFAFPATVLHPGHLVGPGWVPLNPVANFNPRVFMDLGQGNEITMPNFGRETLHHVHAEDVAQAFVKAMRHWSSAAGESFHVVSPAAITMVGYAEAVASWYGAEARIRFMPWEEWRKSVPEKDAQITWDHIARSPNCSIEKARRLLDYRPCHGSLNAIRESLSHLFTGAQAEA
jgi:nucleoside-diphosphate-sugar epimerase